MNSPVRPRQGTPPVRFYRALRDHHAALRQRDPSSSAHQIARRLGLPWATYRRLQQFSATHASLIESAALRGDWAPVESVIFNGWGDYRLLPSFQRAFPATPIVGPVPRRKRRTNLPSGSSGVDRRAAIVALVEGCFTHEAIDAALTWYRSCNARGGARKSLRRGPAED